MDKSRAFQLNLTQTPMTKDDTPQGVTKGIGLLFSQNELGLREQFRLRSQPCFGTLRRRWRDHRGDEGYHCYRVCGAVKLDEE